MMCKKIKVKIEKEKIKKVSAILQVVSRHDLVVPILVVEATIVRPVRNCIDFGPNRPTDKVNGGILQNFPFFVTA